MSESVKSFILIIFLITVSGAIVYTLFFKARDFSHPSTARGIGFALLAGVIKLSLLLLEEYGFSWFQYDWINVALGVMVGIGIIMIMLGFGD